MFDIGTDSEIEEMVSAIIDKKEAGTLDSFVKENDHTNKIGFVTFYACKSNL